MNAIRALAWKETRSLAMNFIVFSVVGQEKAPTENSWGVNNGGGAGGI